MTRRVAIIGAGPGGLAASMLLSARGAEVTVYERHARVGGRSAPIDAVTSGGNFRFDTGPTFFLYPRVLADIFAACGRDMNRHIDLIKLDPQYDLIFENGGKLRASPDYARMQEEIARLAPGDAASLPRFMADNRAKLKAFRPVLEAPFHGLRDLISPAMLRSLALLRPWQSVDGDLARYFKDERVRLAFSFQSKYLGMSPFRCPSLFTILSFMEYEYGVFHPKGGCGAVMNAMADVAREQGVQFRLSTQVTEILRRGRRATGIRTADGIKQYDAVVVNADFAHAMTTLLPDTARPHWSDAKLARKKFSCSAFMLYLGLRGNQAELGHHSIYLAENYRRNVADIEAGRAPVDPSFYVQNACVTEPGLAPAGHSTLYVLVPVGNLSKRATDWTSAARDYRSHILERLKRIGLVNLESRICFEKMVTPLEWQGDLTVHEGATFNLAHSLDQMLCFRPHNRFEDVDRLYLVGGGTHPGSGLPVIFESARISCQLLAEDLGLPSTSPAPITSEADEIRTILEDA